MTITAVSKYAALKNIKVAPSGTDCCIDVDIKCNRRGYKDSIYISTSRGHVKINGNHVHELMKSVLRFADRDMLELWVQFAIVTNKAAGRKDLDTSVDGSRWSIEYEKKDRETELKFNEHFRQRQKERAA